MLHCGRWSVDGVELRRHSPLWPLVFLLSCQISFQVKEQSGLHSGVFDVDLLLAQVRLLDFFVPTGREGRGLSMGRKVERKDIIEACLCWHVHVAGQSANCPQQVSLPVTDSRVDRASSSHGDSQWRRKESKWWWWHG